MTLQASVLHWQSKSNCVKQKIKEKQNTRLENTNRCEENENGVRFVICLITNYINLYRLRTLRNYRSRKTKERYYLKWPNTVIFKVKL